MNSFENHLLESQPITHNIVKLLGEIREFKGKQDLFKKQSPQILKNLTEIATIQSVESSNRIERIIAPHRIGLINETRGAKTASVLNILDNFHGEFSIQEVHELCPTVGIDLIRRILREEKSTGRFECLGRGPFAKWRKCRR